MQQALATLPAHRPRGIGKIEPLPLPGISKTHGRNRRPIFHAPKWQGLGDARRIKYLRTLAEDYGNDPRMREFVVNQILRPAGVKPRDYAGQAAALLRWVQTNIYYTNEPGEQLQIPWVTLEWRTGDCDDQAILLAALAESIALPWRYALAGKDPRTGGPARWVEPPKGVKVPARARKPDKRIGWSHIYVVIGWPPFRPTQWASAEPTLPPAQAPLGFDVTAAPRVPAAAPGGMPELAGFGAPVAQSAMNPDTCGVCTCPGDEPEEDGPWLARMVKRVEWDLIFRDVIVAVLSTAAIGYFLRQRR